MITFTMCGKMKKFPKLNTARIICPACFEDCYTFYAACPECGADIHEASFTISNGVGGRLCYHKNGWPDMDRMASERRVKLLSKTNPR